MSAQESTKCPFTIQPETNDPDKETKDRYITFETPIDPTNQNSMKIKQSALVTIDSDPEAIIRHEVQFERLRTQLTLNDAAPRKAVYEATLGPELLIKWEDACVQAPVNCAAFATLTLAEFNAGREQFVLKFMDRSIATNTKSWLNNQLKKPKSMTITDFTSRVSKICSYFPHMPRPRDTTPATTRIAAPDEEDQITILQNACPATWKESLVKSNQSSLSLQETIDYYTALKNLEPAAKAHNNNNNNSNFQSNNRNSRNKRGNKNRQGDCIIHGRNCGHTTEQCQVIRNQRNEVNSRRSSNQSNNNRNNSNNNNRNSNYRQNNNNSNYHNSNNRNNNNYRRGNNNQGNRNNNGNYNNNSNYGNNNNNNNYNNNRSNGNQYNNNINESNNNNNNNYGNNSNYGGNDNPQEDNNEIIEDNYAINQKVVPAPNLSAPEDITAELKVELINNNTGKHVYALGLADTGAKSVFIKRSVLRTIPHTIEEVKIKSQGRYGPPSEIRQQATFQIKLPQFTSSRTINITAYIEDNATGRHDIILGLRCLSQLGIVLDLKHKTMIWDDVSVALTPPGTLSAEDISNIDPADAHLPPWPMTTSKKHFSYSRNMNICSMVNLVLSLVPLFI